MTGFIALMILSSALLVVVLAFVTLNRYIRYKERVALVQLGLSMEELDREAESRRGNRGVLWGGVITAMSGLALLLGLSTIGIGAWLIGGLLPLFVGMGMVLIYFMTQGSAPAVKPEAGVEERKGPTDEDQAMPFATDPRDAAVPSDGAEHAPRQTE